PQPLPFSLTSPRPHPALLSFPTRRSSDLIFHGVRGGAHGERCRRNRWCRNRMDTDPKPRPTYSVIYSPGSSARKRVEALPASTRSEEHTSELQSRFDLVCRLLLEKKKKKQ